MRNRASSQSGRSTQLSLMIWAPGNGLEADDDHPEVPVEPRRREAGPAAEGKSGVVRERPRRRVCGRHLAEHPHHHHDEDAGERIGEERRRADVVDDDSRADEEAGADDAPDGDHRQVPLLESLVELGVDRHLCRPLRTAGAACVVQARPDASEGGVGRHLFRCRRGAWRVAGGVRPESRCEISAGRTSRGRLGSSGHDGRRGAADSGRRRGPGGARRAAPAARQHRQPRCGAGPRAGRAVPLHPAGRRAQGRALDAAGRPGARGPADRTAAHGWRSTRSWTRSSRRSSSTSSSPRCVRHHEAIAGS